MHKVRILDPSNVDALDDLVNSTYKLMDKPYQLINTELRHLRVDMNNVIINAVENMNPLFHIANMSDNGQAIQNTIGAAMAWGYLMATVPHELEAIINEVVARHGAMEGSAMDMDESTEDFYSAIERDRQDEHDKS
ncbi:hypothetical protein LCGC14_0315950 [marine sediment metagenome]|uniref:Uncharacterized protein n=1 Tax=marine sediment metagenome TaxID=412755 RepID=A0A0F9WSA8_9ZZZZ